MNIMKSKTVVASTIFVLLAAGAAALLSYKDPTCAAEIVKQPLPERLSVRTPSGDLDVGAMQVRDEEIRAAKEHRHYCRERAKGWLGKLDSL